MDLFRLAEDKMIVIEYGNFEKNKSLSVLIGNREFIGIDESVSEDSAEERVHLAHELGHCATGAFYKMYSPLAIRGQYEHKAMKWAILHCVPKDELIELLRKGYQVDEIAEHFGVTEDMIHTAYTYYFEYGITV